MCPMADSDSAALLFAPWAHKLQDFAITSKVNSTTISDSENSKKQISENNQGPHKTCWSGKNLIQCPYVLLMHTADELRCSVQVTYQHSLNKESNKPRAKGLFVSNEHGNKNQTNSQKTPPKQSVKEMRKIRLYILSSKQPMCETKKSRNYTTNHIKKEQNTNISFLMSYFKTFPVVFCIAQDQLHRKRQK